MRALWLVVLTIGCNGQHAKTPVETPAEKPVAATPPTPPTPPATTPVETPPEPIDPTVVGEPPAGVPAPAYAVLFEKGRSWTVEGTQVKEAYIDEKNERTESNFTTTCKVEEVGRHPWGVTSTVLCAEGLPGSGMANLVEGGWVATASGLYNVNSTPTAKIDLEADHRVLQPVPAEMLIQQSNEDEGWSMERQVTSTDGGWCYSMQGVGGDEGWQSICIDAKTGITSGTYGWAGGSSDEVTFLVK